MKNIPRTSAVSSTNFRSILIFASCVVGTCNTLDYMGDFLLGGVTFFVHYRLMVSDGILTVGGEF